MCKKTDAMIGAVTTLTVRADIASERIQTTCHALNRISKAKHLNKKHAKVK